MANLRRRLGALRHRVPTYFAIVLAATALLCAVAAVSVALGGRTQPVRAVIDQLFVPAPANLAYAVFLILLAAGVNNRKHVAYLLLLGFLALEAIGDALLVGDRFTLRMLHLEWEEGVHFPSWIIPHLTIGNLVITTALLVTLVWARREFAAKVQRASLPQAVATFVGSLLVLWPIGWLLAEKFPGSLRTMSDRAVWTLERILGGALTFDVTRYGRAPGWVNLTLGLFGAIALLSATWVLLRSQRAQAVLAPEEESRLRALLDEHGDRDSLGYFATRRDKQVVFSPSGKAAVTYRVVAGVILASGDPIGDPEAWGPAIDAWLARAREYAWTPAVMGASEEGATAYARTGLRVIELGDEAILYPDRFTLDGPDLRQVRQAVHRVTRGGYTIRIRRHQDISATEMTRITHLAAHWRDTETERGFSMALGRLGDPSDAQCVLVEALDPQGREAALLSFTPWGANGLSLDLMRRDRSSDNGLVEAMVVALLNRAPDLGVRRVSLNFAVFRAVFEDGARIGAGPVLVIWRRLLLFLSRWFQLESLYRSNVKYRPQWVPRFLCFEDVRDLAKVGLASGIAEGFLVVPSLPTLVHRGASRRTLPELAADRVPAAPSATAQPPPTAGEAPDPGSEQATAWVEKLAALRAAGIDPYPPAVVRSHTCAEVRTEHPDLLPDTATGTVVSIAGRVLSRRGHGGITFAKLEDWTGDLQVILATDQLGADGLRTFRATVDLGDHLSVTGEVVTSRRGELSVRAHCWTLAAKCLRPLPDKHLDLIVDPGASQRLRTRSTALHAARSVLVEQGFLDVGTRMPHLKRLVGGGVERVFTVGGDVLGDDVDATLNPEPTTLEAYRAYADYHTMRDLVHDVITAAATAAFGSPVVHRTGPDGAVAGVDLGGDWPVVPVYDAVSSALGDKIDPGTDPAVLRRLAEDAQIQVNPTMGPGDIVLDLYERLVAATTHAPTFYTGFPVDVSPQARAHRLDPRMAERWDLVAFGVALATGCSELTDPVEQRRRLVARSACAAAGGWKVADLDEELLSALEHAMPPTGGLGLRVDRLIVLLTGDTIRKQQ